LNPTVLLEVTSDTTEDFDRGTKFLHYQSIASLEDYLIVSHREKRIDHYHRLDDGRWHLTTHSRDDAAAELPALQGNLRIADIYSNVDLSEGRSG
jgi:Uma2 family endonuclease